MMAKENVTANDVYRRWRFLCYLMIVITNVCAKLMRALHIEITHLFAQFEFRSFETIALNRLQLLFTGFILLSLIYNSVSVGVLNDKIQRKKRARILMSRAQFISFVNNGIKLMILTGTKKKLIKEEIIAYCARSQLHK